MHPSSGFPRCFHRSARTSLLWLLSTLTAFPLLTSQAPAQSHTQGSWKSPFKMRDPIDTTGTAGTPEIAVHMAALRGNSDSTHVLYWYHGFAARLMINAVDGTTARHVDVKTGNAADQGYIENFCAGHSTLADGRLFVAGGAFGGTGDAQSGSRFAEIFDPRQYTSATRGWTKPDSMPSNRWYPTVTTLGTIPGEPDGSVLVTQGDEHYQLLQYGGVATNDTAQNDLRTFAISSASPFWKAETVQTDAGTVRYERTGHSAVYLGVEEVALFGGKRASGEFLANLQFTYREDTTDSDQRWVLYDPGALGTPPSPRWKHAADEIIFTPPDTALGDKAIIICGGQGASGLLNDVHELVYVKVPPPAGWKWRTLLPTGNAPSPRFAHVAVYDRGEGVGTSTADSSRLLVFGGRDAGGLADNAVYALPLGTDSPEWYVAIAANADSNQVPSKREGHVAIFDPVGRPESGPSQKRQMVLFGGRDSSGLLVNDAWVLERPKTSMSYSWKKLNPGGRPAARMDAAVVFDDKRQRMVVFGGDDNGPTSGGERSDVWGLPLAATQSADSVWKAMPSMGALGARAGQAVAYIHSAKPVKNRLIQRFVPTAATGQQWKTLTWAPKLMPGTYPFMFVLPNGNVAWVGPNVSMGCQACSENKTMVLNPDETSPSRGWQSTTWSNQSFWGGAAVMYSATPDSVSILKAGSNYDFGGSSDSYIIAFAANGGSGGWRRVAAGPSGALTTRKSHNLTLLPTGEVLATGGSGIGAKSRAQIWNPATQLWSAELAEEPKVRNRHSTTALLPDGRVVSAGGSNESQADAQDAIWGTVYEPPYLFDSTGAYVTQPVISGNPARAIYGAVFTVCCDSAQTIDRVCLIRPGATTHGFDQNQRYVPLSYVKATNPARLLVTAPANANIAPPGDYYLFVCDSTGGRSIPSVGRWIALGSPTGNDTCDTVAPAAVADLSGCYHYYDPYQGQIDLAWTAPADDGTLAASGRGRVYDIRYSYQPINTETQFNNATPVGGTPPLPATVGTQQTHRFGDFNPNTVVYFRMKTIDDRGQYVNASGLSNQAVVYTSSDCSEGEGFYGGSGGGGGGGFRARRSAGESSAQLGSLESTSFVENSLLNGARLGEPMTDTYRLAVPPQIENGTYAVRIRTAGTSAAGLDAARLLVVDRALDVRAYASGAGVVVGSRVPATRVTTADGQELTAVLNGSGEFTFAAGDVLTVELAPHAGGPGGAPGQLVVEAGTLANGAADDGVGVVVQIPDGEGGWQPLRRIYPRENFHELVMDDVDVGTVRLLFERGCSVRFVGRLVNVAEPAQTEWTNLVSTRSSRLGDVGGALVSADSASVTLFGPDTLSLRFSVPAHAEGTVRDFFLQVEATVMEPRPTLPPATAATQVLPSTFALHQNQPNPFSGRTTIRFELPLGAMVRLELFDLHGRRVRVLTDRYFPPGSHAVEWDKGTGDGNSVGPGVYFYRIHAGPFRDRKKLVLLP